MNRQRGRGLPRFPNSLDLREAGWERKRGKQLREAREAVEGSEGRKSR